MIRQHFFEFEIEPSSNSLVDKGHYIELSLSGYKRFSLRDFLISLGGTSAGLTTGVFVAWESLGLVKGLPVDFILRSESTSYEAIGRVLPIALILGMAAGGTAGAYLASRITNRLNHNPPRLP